MPKKERALTTEEYVARAAMLGFSVYDDVTHTYWRAGDDVELDADTLEPIDKEERNKRYLEYAKELGYESGGFYGGKQATKSST